ncbi:hypothetical protein F5887DRAFT_941805 [Amanita rubescens]|nr:hypothetical protein F5887DRAFT_959277 [Amanita rubescens]KAF8349657.1 hypothetical protein F5887DRAFT_941805 [Amanita rubescens]
MSDSYSVRPGGALKLKGGLSEGGVVKKKKKKSKSKQDTELEAERNLARELNLKEDAHSPTPVGSGQSTPAVVNNGSSKKTDAEKRFEEAQKRRLAQRVAKLARKTHKDRVNEFNSHLETLSEHHDIPKVGPG